MALIHYSHYGQMTLVTLRRKVALKVLFAVQLSVFLDEAHVEQVGAARSAHEVIRTPNLVDCTNDDDECSPNKL